MNPVRRVVQTMELREPTFRANGSVSLEPCAPVTLPDDGAFARLFARGGCVLQGAIQFSTRCEVTS